MVLSDKLNNVDYQWFLVRTRPGHEQELCALVERERDKVRNILEVYCPTHTKVCVRQGDNERRMPLFDGYVFVLATQGALVEFLRDNNAEAYLRYNRKRTPEEKATACTIPESQMRAFRDYNENYADKVVVLERPYTDYAFNPKTEEPNEIVRVIDGPLAGCEGYVCRFHRKKGLVFYVQGVMPGSWLTVTYPNVADLHVVRLHNAEGDRLSIGTEKGRAVDLLVGILQACGYGERTRSMLYDEHDTPGYVRENWPKILLRPFLTPTSGVEMEEGKDEAELRHGDFTEIIRRVDIAEEVYYPSRQEDGRVTTTYHAHIGMKEDKESLVFFANWDDFLGAYFLTAGKANEKLVSGQVRMARNGTALAETEKLVESFRNYAPTLYKLLTDADSPVKAVPGFKVGEETLNVLAIRSSAEEKDAAKDELIKTCVRICTEVNTTNHLAVWRRYLRTVWLHV